MLTMSTINANLLPQKTIAKYRRRYLLSSDEVINIRYIKYTKELTCKFVMNDSVLTSARMYTLYTRVRSIQLAVASNNGHLPNHK
jgi:hypothetical protein